MKTTKCFRLYDGVGPDYFCSKCGLRNHRLWRESYIFLGQIELFCAVCGEKREVENIKAYASFRDPNSSSIGNLIPARPTLDGSTFWGHTSGDVEWWYALPQYEDSKREMKLVKQERDFAIRRLNSALKDMYG